MMRKKKAGAGDLPEEGRHRVIIEGVSPEIDGGLFPIKRTAGERVIAEIDAYTDGHTSVTCTLLHRKCPESEAKRKRDAWVEVPMEPLVNDRWRASFAVPQPGRYEYTFTARVDHFQTWRRDLKKRIEAGQEVSLDLKIGAQLIAAAAERAEGEAAGTLRTYAERLQGGADNDTLAAAVSDDLEYLMRIYPDERFTTVYPRMLQVEVERERARFSTWYEFFPRSAAGEPGRHGTFRDAEQRLPYVAAMGFDVIYLPPIHPIGMTKRKGKDNALIAEPGEPGSPWAIGGPEGGHKAIHPELGSLEDFRRFVQKAGEHGIEVALDIAFQCSPDHPYVKQHPEWFQIRPDGTIQYAENPPKKYEDIYPFDFETEHWGELWEELRSVVLHWVDQGVRIFRVDNPHTKSFAFWEWTIRTVRERHPDVFFLAEAFTRPKVMYYLAKIGFSQSYNYFPWRNQRWELEQYFAELTQTEVREYFRPNLWPNTPDILTEYLQHGGRPAFVIRAALAATLGASYGIYGPAFELCEYRPRNPGSEEYLHSEKYEVRQWDLDRVDSLREIIARINRIRREHRALQWNDSLRFHATDHHDLLCYSKTSPDGRDVMLMVVNVNPHWTHSGWIDLDLACLGIAPDEGFTVHDLLSDARYQWRGPRNYVELNPHVVPVHIFEVRKGARGEKDFEYYG
jgi:starch synthase (maltosyl-transferring)